MIVRRSLAVAGLVAVVAAATAARPWDGASRRAPDPLRGLRLFVDPESPAAAQARADAAAGDAVSAALMRRIADAPVASWLTGTPPQARAEAAAAVRRAAAARATAVLVLYAIPQRDCGGASSGGAPDPAGYRRWVDAVARGIGAHRAVAIVEPDATAQVAEGCLAPDAAAAREALLRYALTALQQRTRAVAYLDAGNARWLPASRIAPVLRRSGVAHADGFAINVGNFYSTAESRRYGHALSHGLRGAHFVIDTSRNGNGSYHGALRPRWCNPPGRALGQRPTTDTGDGLVDAFLWVKRPGDSDGPCRPGEPPAGTWWPAAALELARGAR